MNFKKYLRPFLSRPISEEPRNHHIRKFGFNWRRFGFLFTVPAVLLFLLFTGVAFGEASNIRVLAAKFIKPKPIVQSSTILSANIQSAIQNLASQEIKAETANANLAVNSNLTQTSQGGLIQPLIDTIQETLTLDPSSKAKIKLRVIDSEIAQLQNLLEKDKSDKAADQAVKLIADIGQKTGGVVTDPKVQINREILKLQIEQYNRLQLILQKLEDSLPITSYLKIEDARGKYLVSGAQASLNAAPNLDAIHNIAIKEVGRLVGNDFAELKAIEVLSDLEGGLKPDTLKKLNGLEKELAIQFEKKMLKLPPDVRNRKLQDYIKYSFGNPLNQVESFERIKSFLTDREMILGTDSLKELALKKLENRVFEINDQNQLNQFLDLSFRKPDDLKILAQMKLDVLSSKDETRKKKIADLEEKSTGKVVAAFGSKEVLNAFFSRGASSSADLLDVSLISQLSDTLHRAPQVSADVKEAISLIKQKILVSFTKAVTGRDFLTKQKLSFNPVSENADVRLLLPAPQAIALLENAKTDLPATTVAIAKKAGANLVADHLLTQVRDPQIFEQYQEFIADNSQVKQTLQNYVGQTVLADLNKKGQVIKEEVKKNDQALYEKVQQITQDIFTGHDALNEEKQLPEEIQTQVDNLKKQLADSNVPKIETPPGVKLPEVAKLPTEVEQAIVIAAKDQIKKASISYEAKLDLEVQAKDLGVSEPTILPGNLLYPIVEILREIPVLLTSDPVEKAGKQLSIDNSRTLEVAKLLEGSQSQETITQALAVLDKINQDFDLLKAHVDDLKKEGPAKVDKLVDQIIENGLARQTVLSSIENKVYGDDYVKVETQRQNVLKNGISVLLDLTDQNAKKLTDKLEVAVQNSQGSDLKDFKAVELLTEIARTQPKPVAQILKKAEESLAQNLETKLLAMPVEKRTREVLAYGESAPGNPILQFEGYDNLKNDFKNPETIALVEGLKDKAVENLTEKFSEITDATSRQVFVDAVVGNQPQDLKIVMEIEQRVMPVVTTKTSETLSIVEKVKAIKAEVEQNIIDTYKDKPAELVQTDFYQTAIKSADVTDITVAQELVNVLSRSPEVAPEVVAVAKAEETKVVDSLVSEIQTNSTNTHILSPVPEIVAELVKLKDQTPPSVDAKIDLVIKAEVKLIEDHLTTQVNDPVTFQSYLAQIKENPVVTQTITQVGGTQFTQAVEQKAQIIETQATTDKTQLQTTVTQITQEIFSAPASSPSVVEQTLPQTVQQEITQIKQEVPKEQIPAVQVQAIVTVTAPPPAAEAPVAPTVGL